MSAHQKDLRMVDDLDQSDEVRSLLRTGIDEDVAGYDFEAGLAAHMAAIVALPTAAESAQVPQPVAASAGISGKALIAWIGIPVASASVIAALWLGGSSEEPRAVTPAPLTNVAKTVPIVATRAAEPVAVVVTPVSPATNTHSIAAGTDTPRATRSTATRAQRNAAATRDPKLTGTSVTPSSEDAVDATAVEAMATAAAETTVTSAEPVEVGPTAAEREAIAKQAAEDAAQEQAAREEARRVVEECLKREMAQLMQAKQALTSNPARALSLAQAGEQEFRDSLFSEERQHVLLLALIKLGRLDEAERRAQPYLRAHPDSPFARRVRNALEDAK